jgi:hypothetical protein
VPADLFSVIAATTRWLLRAYPHVGGAFSAARAENQAREAVTVAAWLRYPTVLDASLLAVVGPGGAAHLDRLTRADPVSTEEWRSGVDEVVASWAACLLADREVAVAAVAVVSASEHRSGPLCDFRRLTDPDERECRAAALLRHPDLLAPVADLHASELRQRLGRGSAAAA